jgi:ketosteroid isomerase-like protein
VARATAPDVELATDTRWPDGGVYRGREGVGGFLDAYADAFTTEGGETTDLVDAGDKAAVRLVARVRGRGSAVATENRFTAVYTFQNGLIARIQFFFDHREALEAVGLREGGS